MVRRTLMQRNQELVDFEVDLVTGKSCVIDMVQDSNLLASAGLTQQNVDMVLSLLLKRRALSPLRTDKEDILAAFGAKSPVDLALRGHGLSLSDLFWYRSPGSNDCWEDINFFDNGWDPGFGTAVLLGDYASLRSCSPNVPEVTTSGHAIKAWERSKNGIFLVKAAIYPNGEELMGVKLATELCAALFDEDCFIPTSVEQRYGRPCSVSALMLDADEELADGNRLFAMAGMQNNLSPGGGSITAKACNDSISAYLALGIADASAHVARMACFSCLSLLQDYNPSNFGAIRKAEAGTWRAAPIFDYDGAFGFPFNGIALSDLCKSPLLAQLFCASRFNFLEPSWDWSWYDPQALNGFENRIIEMFADNQNLPSSFAELIASLFVMQRKCVNKVAIS